MILVGVGDEKTARGEGRCSLINATASSEFVGSLRALFSRKRRVHERVRGQPRGASELSDVVSALSAAAASSASRFEASCVIWSTNNLLGCCLNQTASSLRGVPGAITPAALTSHAAGRSVSRSSAATGSTTAAAAARSTVLGSAHGREVLVFAALAFNLSSA